MGLITDIARFIQYGDLPTWYYTKRGMNVGKNFNRQSGCKFDPSHCWLISVGDDVTFANKVQILAHDDSPRFYTGYGKLGLVNVGSRVFVGANTTILMGVTIGDDVIIGAGSVVTKDIPSGSVAAGNPCRVICSIGEYVDKIKNGIETKHCFDNTYSYDSKDKNLSDERKREMVEILSKDNGFLFLDKFCEGKK